MWIVDDKSSLSSDFKNKKPFHAPHSIKMQWTHLKKLTGKLNLTVGIQLVVAFLVNTLLTSLHKEPKI